ncbi:MAG: beta-propeller fold lactonase family protein [Acidobacteria bacterium]|nr:beta-propeller fold lactonase family protein [Acidobacteriota bacterium]
MRLLLLLSFAAVLPGQTLLVLEKAGSALGFYSPGGDKQATVAVGRHPHEMALSPDRRYLYCTDNGTMLIEQPGTGGNTVSIVDLKARRRAGQIDLGNFRRPHGIDIDPKTGNLLVSTELPDQLLRIDPQARKVVRTYDTKGKTSHMVTLGPGGRFAYVSNANSSSVAAIELDTGAVTAIPTGERPEGSVLSKDGSRLYVACRVGHRITIIDTGANRAIGEIRAGQGPVRIALTPDGKRLVYALHGENKVEIADPFARKVIAQVPVGGQPVSLNLSRDGKLAYAAAQDQDTIYVISVADARIVRQWKTSAGAGPDPVLEFAAP